MSDLIKREDAIKAIHNYWKKRLDTLPTKESEYGEVYADIQQMDKILEHNKALCNFIEAIPSADRPQEWIPCSERLPSEKDYIGDVVIWCTDKSIVGVGWYYESTKSWATIDDTFPPILGEVIAWMPLPKPWKGADDE